MNPRVAAGQQLCAGWNISCQDGRDAKICDEGFYSHWSESWDNRFCADKTHKMFLKSDMNSQRNLNCWPMFILFWPWHEKEINHVCLPLKKKNNNFPLVYFVPGFQNLCWASPAQYLTLHSPLAGTRARVRPTCAVPITTSSTFLGLAFEVMAAHLWNGLLSSCLSFKDQFNSHFIYELFPESSFL